MIKVLLSLSTSSLILSIDDGEDQKAGEEAPSFSMIYA
jgi:hypothetical protein